MPGFLYEEEEIKEYEASGDEEVGWHDLCVGADVRPDLLTLCG